MSVNRARQCGPPSRSSSLRERPGLARSGPRSRATSKPASNHGVLVSRHVGRQPAFMDKAELGEGKCEEALNAQAVTVGLADAHRANAGASGGPDDIVGRVGGDQIAGLVFAEQEGKSSGSSLWKRQAGADA